MSLEADFIKVSAYSSELGKSLEKLESGSATGIELDLSSAGFVTSEWLVLWKCIIERAKELSKRVSIVPPAKAANLDYAGRMGLFEDTTYNYPYNASTPITFFPLLRIRSDGDLRLYDECQRVLGAANLAQNQIYTIAEAFSELADNIYFHSGTTENSGWGYIHAQVYHAGTWFWKRGYLRLAVCDLGVGIFGSYQRTNQIRGRSQKQVVKDSLNLGDSSLNPAPREGHRGIGLNDVKNFVSDNDGHLVIKTGDVHLDLRKEKLQVKNTSFFFGGTNIELKVPIL